MKYDVGKIFKSNKCGEFIIIEKINTQRRRVKFLQTGYETDVTISGISRGEVRDRYAPSVFGVGILGDCTSKHYLYDRWSHMLARCYDESCSSYQTYGKLGVSVCEEWFYFENYIKDIESLQNSEKLIQSDGKNWHIDKDIKFKGNNIYSKDTVLIVKSDRNSSESNERNKDKHIQRISKPINMFDLDGNFIRDFDSAKQAKEFVRPEAKGAGNITDCANGKQKTAYGYKWAYKL